MGCDCMGEWSESIENGHGFTSSGQITHFSWGGEDQQLKVIKRTLDLLVELHGASLWQTVRLVAVTTVHALWSGRYVLEISLALATPATKQQQQQVQINNKTNTNSSYTPTHTYLDSGLPLSATDEKEASKSSSSCSVWLRKNSNLALNMSNV